MRDILCIRTPAKQRAVALYEDQEKEIRELNEKLPGKQKISYTDIVREGVDRVLEDLKKSVEGDK